MAVVCFIGRNPQDTTAVTKHTKGMVRFTKKQERLNVAMNPDQGLRSGSSFKTVALRGSHKRTTRIGGKPDKKKKGGGKFSSSLDSLAFGPAESDGDDSSSVATSSASSSASSSSGGSRRKQRSVSTRGGAPPRRMALHHPPAISDSDDSGSESDLDSDGCSVMTSVSGGSSSSSDASLGAYAVKKKPGGNMFSGMSKHEAEEVEKNDLLARFHVLRQRGVHLAKNFTPKSGLTEMRLEMGRIEHEASMGKAVKINRRWFLAGAAGLSKATDNFGPNITRGRWHGFDKHLLAQIDDFNDPFERLSEHYGGVVGAVTGGNPLWEIGVLFVYQFLMYGLASTGGEKARAAEGLSVEEVREKFPHVIQEAVKLELARQRQEDEAQLRQAQLQERARADAFDRQQAAFHEQLRAQQAPPPVAYNPAPVPLLPPQFDPRVLTGHAPPPQEQEQGILHQSVPGHVHTPAPPAPVAPSPAEPFEEDMAHEEILLQAGGIGLGPGASDTTHPPLPHEDDVDDTEDEPFDFRDDEPSFADELSGLEGDVGELAYTLATRTGEGRPDIPPNKRDLARGGMTIDVN